MSAERVTRWKCDGIPGAESCWKGQEVFKSGYGLPSGWKWHPPKTPGGSITHSCDECTAEWEFRKSIGKIKS